MMTGLALFAAGVGAAVNLQPPGLCALVHRVRNRASQTRQ
jgi:hypothetical protein